ncbi:MAG: pyridoxal phosphate-dependent aminotransferase [Planctomycetes bacterium]|nr:pyridoxal phosphate-dependent aminotransferase [Planctomycetota bacterium]
MKLSQRAIDLAESATLAVAARAAKMKAEGVDVVGFGAGEPDFGTPEHICEAGIAAIKAGHTGYPKPASGLAETKKAVCERFERVNGLSYTPQQTIITSGGKECIHLAVHAVIDPGDEVVIPVPYWVSYPEIVRLAGGVPVVVAGAVANDYKVTPDLLRAVLTDRTRMVIINSPSNPSGVTYEPDEIRALASVLTEREVLILSDEIYDELLYDGQRTLSYAAVNDDAYAQTLTVNSASKTYAMTGWRLGYAGGPVDVVKAMAKLQSQSTSGAATFSQIALATALTGDQSAVESMRVEFERRGKHMWKRLTSMSGVACPKPTGAFYCFPDVSATFARLGVSSSREFAARLLEKAKVAVVPGIAFGMDAHVRLSFATSMEEIDKGLDRLAAFLE